MLFLIGTLQRRFNLIVYVATWVSYDGTRHIFVVNAVGLAAWDRDEANTQHANASLLLL